MSLGSGIDERDRARAYSRSASPDALGELE